MAFFFLPVEDSLSSSIAKMIMKLRSGYISGVRYGVTIGSDQFALTWNVDVDVEK